MDLYRLRIEVVDDPGRLGRVLVALGRLGVDVVEIDCHNVDGTVRVDDLLVHLTRPLDIPAIGRAVEHAGCRSIDVRPVSLHQLQDPVIRAMRLIAHVTRIDSVSAELLAWCAGELVQSDLAYVLDERTATTDSIAGKALTGHVEVHGRQWVKRLPSSGAPPWTLAAPFAWNGRRAAVVLHRTTSPFTRTETARLLTLLDAATQRSTTPSRIVHATPPTPMPRNTTD